MICIWAMLIEAGKAVLSKKIAGTKLSYVAELPYLIPLSIPVF